MMRFVGFALLACPSSAAEILSLGLFKKEYDAGVTDGFALANKGIIGASEPSSNLKLWSWYRNVDAATQAEAKVFMDAKVAPASSVQTVVDFSTKYTAAVAAPITDANVAAQAVVTREVMAATRPAANPKTQAAWDAYQLLDAADKAAVKDTMVYKPFIDGFTKLWDADWVAANTWKKYTMLASDTMAASAPADAAGVKRNKFWKAMTEADSRKALQKVMFSGANSFASM